MVQQDKSVRANHRPLQVNTAKQRQHTLSNSRRQGGISKPVPCLRYFLQTWLLQTSRHETRRRGCHAACRGSSARWTHHSLLHVTTQVALGCWGSSWLLLGCVRGVWVGHWLLLAVHLQHMHWTMQTTDGEGSGRKQAMQEVFIMSNSAQPAKNSREAQQSPKGRGQGSCKAWPDARRIIPAEGDVKPGDMPEHFGSTMTITAQTPRLRITATTDSLTKRSPLCTIHLGHTNHGHYRCMLV